MGLHKALKVVHGCQLQGQQPLSDSSTTTQSLVGQVLSLEARLSGAHDVDSSLTRSMDKSSCNIQNVFTPLIPYPNGTFHHQEAVLRSTGWVDRLLDLFRQI